MEDRAPRIPPLLLERYALGDLPPAEQERMRKSLEADPTLRAQLDELGRSNGEILQTLPPERVVPEIKRRLRSARAEEETAPGLKRRPFPVWGMPLVVSLLLLFVIIPVRHSRVRLPVGERAGDLSGEGTGDRSGGRAGGLSGEGTGNPPGGPPFDAFGEQAENITRAKGLVPKLVIFVNRDSRVTRLNEGDEVREGDLLRLGYVAASARHGVIVSIDGRGTVTLHAPRQGGTTQLEGPDQVLLPESYELDDAPSFERFFLVTADGDMDIADIEEAARSLALSPSHARSQPLEVPSGLEQTSLLLNKVEVRQ